MICKGSHIFNSVGGIPDFTNEISHKNDITKFIYLESYHSHYNIQRCASYFMHLKYFKIKAHLLYITVKRSWHIKTKASAPAPVFIIKVVATGYEKREKLATASTWRRSKKNLMELITLKLNLKGP